MMHLPKNKIQQLAASGLSNQGIIEALGLDKQQFDDALKQDAVFARLLDKLVMDYYLRQQHEQSRKN